MYTTHSLHEMQMTSRTPSTHVPREVRRELGPDGLARAISALEAAATPERRPACSTVARAVCMCRQALEAAPTRLLDGVAALLRRGSVRTASGRLTSPDARG